MKTRPIIRDISTLDVLTYQIIGGIYKVHSRLGPGLLESAYEVCLEYELQQRGLLVERQRPLPISYGAVELQQGYRLDIVVENSIILEIKSVEEIIPIHNAQLMTYLKIAGLKLGLLLNFNVRNMQKGIHRIIM